MRDVVAHVRDEETNDMIGYFGTDPGDPVIVHAGSIACFSSTVFHRIRRPVLQLVDGEPVHRPELTR